MSNAQEIAEKIHDWICVKETPRSDNSCIEYLESIIEKALREAVAKDRAEYNQRTDDVVKEIRSAAFIEAAKIAELHMPDCDGNGCDIVANKISHLAEKLK